jgi:hypothetical protein
MLTDSAQKCQGFSGASLFLCWSGFHPIGKTEGFHTDILHKNSGVNLAMDNQINIF